MNFLPMIPIDRSNIEKDEDNMLYSMQIIQSNISQSLRHGSFFSTCLWY